MTRTTLSSTKICLAIAVLSAADVDAQTLLTAARKRTTASAIMRDFATLGVWRTRVDALPRDGDAVMRFQRTKADYWLRFAESEYADNERGPVVQAALDRTVALVEATEGRQELTAAEEPLPRTAPIRADLHDRVRIHVRRGVVACAPEALGEMAVLVVAAAHAPGSVGRQQSAAAIARAEELDRQLSGVPCAPHTVATVDVPPAPVPRPVDDTASVPVPVITPHADTVPRKPLPGSVYFAFGLSTLSAATRERLLRLTTSVKDMTIARIIVTGHTDRTGSRRVNRRLALRRAARVRQFLINAGIASELLTAKGVGSSQPRDRGRSRVANARNRRVEIRVVMSDGTVLEFDDLQPFSAPPQR